MNKKNRPILKLEKTGFDLIVEVSCIIGLLALFILPAWFYPSLPDKMVTHFNAAGDPDGYGSKSLLWLLPVIGLVLYVLLSSLSKVPHKFNYLQEITMDNAEKQYGAALRMMRVLKLWCMILFLYITYGSIQTSLGNQEGLSKYFSAFILISVVAISAYPIIASRKSS